MKVLITDANILIDLLKTETEEIFFRFEHEIHTTPAVIIECDDRQQKTLNRYIKAGSLKVYKFTTEDDEKIEALAVKHRGLTNADCSVFFLADKIEGILLTGDKALRKTAENNKLEVRGIFWVFDEMLKHKVIDKTDYKGKLNRLKEVNRWLPEAEFEKRLKI